MKKVFPLSRLTAAVEKVINEQCSKLIWVKAEIVKINYYQASGHCFPDLVEKKDGKIIAELKGNIWRSNYVAINEKFRRVLGEDLKDDMTVVVQGSISFHPVHGLALNIFDIDPAYTMGELARQRAETLRRLEKEGLIHSNRTKRLPVLPKVLAVISVQSSKGYQDFLQVIEQNPWGYKFQHLLFPAVLQGEKAVTTIKQQLKRIIEYKDIFDAVLIIRGGGGEVGLSCYDNYALARAIAEFPIPILTGIGHSTNQTVSELVSHQSFITPTKVGEFLLQSFHNFSRPLTEGIKSLRTRGFFLLERQRWKTQRLSENFVHLGHRILDRNKHQLDNFETVLQSGKNSLFQKERSQLQEFTKSLNMGKTTFVTAEKNKLREIEIQVELLSPQNILKRGYSITRCNGSIVKKSVQISPGDRLETTLYNGVVTSIVETSKPNNK